MSETQNDELVACLMEDNPIKFKELLERKDQRYVVSAQNATFNLFHSKQPENSTIIIINPAGQTIMHLIAFHDSIQVLLYYVHIHKKFLEQNNYEIFDYKNGEEYLPLHMALYGGSSSVASFILKCRPDLAKYEIPNHPQALALAAYSRNSTLIDLLFHYGVDPNSRLNTDPNFPQPMRIAIQYKDINSIRSLIKGNLHSKSQSTQSPIIYAIHKLYYDAVPLLLDAGENPETVCQQSVKNIGIKISECPLSAACFCGEPAIEAIRAIVSKIPGNLMPNTIEDLCGGPAHWIAQSKSLKVASILAQRQFDPNFLDSKKRSPLYYLLDNGIDIETILGILNIFLQQGFDINREYSTKTPYPPIMEVIKSGETYRNEILTWFAQNGVDPAIKVDQAGHTLRQIVQKKEKLKRIFEPYWLAEN